MSTVTITDVAKHAGVAVSTVSYVLSGKRSISATTRQRVLSSIDVLGYHPHTGSRSAAARRTQVLALVLPLRPGVPLPSLMRQVTAVVTAARQFDHDVLLMTADEDPARLTRLGGRSSVDGVVVLDVERNDPRLPVLRGLDRASVLIGFPAAPEGLTCVGLDHHRAAARCVEHLAGLGHRHVALLGPAEVVVRRRTADAEHTREGFAASTARLGLTGVAESCPDAPADIARVLGKLLADRPEITGLVVANEAALPHVLTALPTLGRPVPEQMSVTAICADQLAECLTPAPSSVPIPHDEIGRQAVSLLMRKLVGAPVPPLTPIAPAFTERAGTTAPPSPAP